MKKTNLKYNKKTGLKNYTDQVFDQNPCLYKELSFYLEDFNLSMEKAKQIFNHDVMVTLQTMNAKPTSKNILKAVNTTMNKAAYISETERDYDNFMKLLAKDKNANDLFRKLNRHQKTDMALLKRVDPVDKKVKSEWIYNNKFKIQIIYIPGTSNYDIVMRKLTLQEIGAMEA